MRTLNIETLMRKSLVIVLALGCAGTTARADWTVARLSSEVPPVGHAVSVAGGAQAGSVWAVVGGGLVFWNGASSPAVVLRQNGMYYYQVEGSSSDQQVGSAVFGVVYPFLTQNHAVCWSGTPASAVDLNPMAGGSSIARGVHAGRQVGNVVIGGVQRASLWSGTAASWISLHPAGSTQSDAFGISANQQVGFVFLGGHQHAGVWTGTAASWVDLNPDGSAASAAFAVHQGQQVGHALVGGIYRASLWTGTFDSWVDLSPPGAIESSARAVHAGQQVGYSVIAGVHRASLWRSTARSWEDLAAVLPGNWDDTYATGVWNDATTLYVVGYGFNIATGNEEPLLWTRPFVCVADFDHSGIVNAQDIFGFLSAWFALDPRADFNADSHVDVADIYSFIASWFAGC